MRIECPSFKKSDGTECKVIIDIFADFVASFHNNVFVLADVKYRMPRKRSWLSLCDDLSHEFKYGHTTDSNDEKEDKKVRKMEEFVGEQALKDAMRYAWMSVKPKILED